MRYYINQIFDPVNDEMFFSDGLLSKFGFCDGDQLDWLYEHGSFDKHLVLTTAVKKWVLPRLNQKVDVEIIGTIHNPIRANCVDGVPYNWAIDSGIHLSPEFIVVPREEILALAREIGEHRTSLEPTV